MIIVVDFDGTLSTRDTVDHLLDQFASSAWKDIEAEWHANKITAIECMQKQLSMVRADKTSLDTFFSEISLDSTFKNFYDVVKAFSDVVIVSDGLDRAIDIALEKSDLSFLPRFANKLHFTDLGIDISWPYKNPNCEAGNGVCKCAVAKSLNQSQQKLILIGDGLSDLCLAKKADIVFAKNSLLSHCRRFGIPHIQFNSFDDVLKVMQSWPELNLSHSAANFPINSMKV